MKRRSKAGGKAVKAGRRKAVTPKRLSPPKIARGRPSATTDQETETARLARERDEALEQLSAASEVLRVVSSSTSDLKPVFETILEKATAICGANFGNLMLYDDGAFRVVAMHGPPRWR